MKRHGELEPRRDAKAAQATLAEKTTDVDKVSQAVVREGKTLLARVAKSSRNETLTPEKMQKTLQDMIKDTPFAGALVIQERDLKDDTYQNMFEIFGRYPEPGSFNVWFARLDGEWVLRYSPVPAGGNLRS